MTDFVANYVRAIGVEPVLGNVVHSWVMRTHVKSAYVHTPYVRMHTVVV